MQEDFQVKQEKVMMTRVSKKEMPQKYFSLKRSISGYFFLTKNIYELVLNPMDIFFFCRKAKKIVDYIHNYFVSLTRFKMDYFFIFKRNAIYPHSS